jgi:hypothetical protein
MPAHMGRPRTAHATAEGAFHNGDDEVRAQWSRDHALGRTFFLLEFEPYSRHFEQQFVLLRARPVALEASLKNYGTVPYV